MLGNLGVMQSVKNSINDYSASDKLMIIHFNSVFLLSIHTTQVFNSVIMDRIWPCGYKQATNNEFSRSRDQIMNKIMRL